MTQAWLNRIDTVVPSLDIHAAFVEFGRDTMVNWRKRALFDRMASLTDIQHRYAIIEPCPNPRDKVLDAVPSAFTAGARSPLPPPPWRCMSRMRWISPYTRSTGWKQTRPRSPT